MSITIYTKPLCPYCIRAKELLSRKNLQFDEIIASHDPALREEMRRRSGGRLTYPQIFFDDRHIGGCDDLILLERAGKLDHLLAALDGSQSPG